MKEKSNTAVSGLSTDSAIVTKLSKQNEQERTNDRLYSKNHRGAILLLCCRGTPHVVHHLQERDRAKTGSSRTLAALALTRLESVSSPEYSPWANPVWQTPYVKKTECARTVGVGAAGAGELLPNRKIDRCVRRCFSSAFTDAPLGTSKD